ncbi:MAG: OadG-related small transporter subunit [Acutalibacteraceae bacterium]
MQTLFASLLAVVTMAIHAQSWKTTLPDMLFGMIGIFIVIGVIILVTYGLNKAFSKKEEKGRQGREIKTK